MTSLRMPTSLLCFAGFLRIQRAFHPFQARLHGITPTRCYLGVEDDRSRSADTQAFGSPSFEITHSALPIVMDFGKDECFVYN